MSDEANMKTDDGLLKILEDRYVTMSKGHKRLAKYTLENYSKVAFMTASKLGETVGVSESTVVRFAAALGFGGYPQFQDALQEMIKTKLTTVQRVQMANRDYSSESRILESVLKSDIENIKETVESLSQENYEKAVDMILGAKKLYIMGLRSSIYVAKYLGYYLNYILDNVVIIRMDMGEPVEQMIRLGKDDVLITVSFPRYSKKTMKVVEYAKERGAKVMAITDSLNSPSAKAADVVVPVKNNIVSFIDSLVPAFSVANALVIGVAMREKEDITSYFKELEELWEQFDIYE